MARNPTFPADEVDRVRDAAIVDLQQNRDDAATIAATVALAGGLRRRPSLRPSQPGTEDGLRAATVDDLRRLHARAYTPATTALVLSGDLTAGRGENPGRGRLRFVGRGLSPPRSTPRRPGRARRPGSSDRVLIVDNPVPPRPHSFLAAPGVARADPDFEPLLVANQVFGGGFSSRLNLNLRETRGYTYAAYSDVDAVRGVGLITIDMAVQTPSTADAVRETFREAETLTTDGVSDDELARAKQYLAGSVGTLFDTNSSTLSTLRTLYLDDLPVDYYATRPARLAGITADAAVAVARRRFPPGAFTVVAVGDRAAIEAPLRALNLGPVALRSP